jgi:hypothetical protein
MNKLRIAGQNLGRVFSTRLGHACICRAIEKPVLDTNAGKQQSQAATDVYLTLGLKK